MPTLPSGWDWQMRSDLKAKLGRCLHPCTAGRWRCSSRKISHWQTWQKSTSQWLQKVCFQAVPPQPLRLKQHHYDAPWTTRLDLTFFFPSSFPLSFIYVSNDFLLPWSCNPVNSGALWPSPPPRHCSACWSCWHLVWPGFLVGQVPSGS